MSEGKVFYGWWIVAATVVILLFGVSSGFYTVSVFLEPLQKSFGWTTTQISLGFTIAALLVGLLSPVVGIAVSKLGVKMVVVYGVSTVGISLLLFGSIQELWQYYVLFILLGSGLVSSYLVPSQTLIAHWFVRRRGIATGIILAGIGMGAMLMVFAASQINAALGWRATYRVLGILALAIALPVTVLVIKNKPQDMGLNPDGDAALTTENQKKSSGFNFTVAQAVKSLTFYFIGLVVIVFNIIAGGLTQHAIALLKDMNVPQASAFWSMVLGVTVFGRLLFGAAADKLSLKSLMITVVLMQIMGMVSLHYVGQSGFLIWGFVLFYGLAMGGFASVYPLLVVNKFGLDHFSKIIGAFGLLQILSFAVGALTLGKMYDASGSYVGAVFVLIILSVSAGVPAVLIGQPRTPKRVVNSE